MEELVAAFLRDCEARGLSPKTVREAYGAHLRAQFSGDADFNGAQGLQSLDLKAAGPPPAAPDSRSSASSGPRAQVAATSPSRIARRCRAAS
jgi:hypothetical protein